LIRRRRIVMSLCRTDCWLRLSDINVTPGQFVSVTVPWSFLSSRQQTRAATFNNPIGAGHSLCHFCALHRTTSHYLLGGAIATRGLKLGRCRGAAYALTASAGPRMSKISPDGQLMKRRTDFPV
jgi:hypothetical protein